MNGSNGENGLEWAKLVKMGWTGGNGSYNEVFCQQISSELKAVWNG